MTLIEHGIISEPVLPKGRYLGCVQRDWYWIFSKAPPQGYIILDKDQLMLDTFLHEV